MKERWKNLKNKKIFLGLGIFLSFLVGFTFAYYSSHDEINNLFRTKEYDSKTIEKFTSPSNWKPGDTTAKNLKVKNTGNVCENVRVWYEEQWLSENGDTLPNTQNGNTIGIINKANLQDWVQDGNYFYYNKDLLSGQTTSSFLKSVTFNKLAMSDVTCSEQQDGSRLCESSGDGYDGATYTLTLHVETIQCSLSEKIWGVDVTDLENDYSIATFDTGQSVNAKVKTMAAGSSKAYSASDALITGFVRSSNLPNNFTPATENTISASNSAYPIYAWYDNGTIYFYSEVDNIKFNATSSYFFNKMSSLANIDDLEYLDTSSVTTMQSMFNVCTSISSLEPISNWNVSNVTAFNNIFYGDTGITSLKPLSDWTLNTVGEVNLSSMFSSCSGLTNLQGLEDWNTAKVTNMSRMFFSDTDITSLQALADWDTSSVKNMSFMFRDCRKYLTSLEGLEDWTVSSVTSMSNMFQNCYNLRSLQALEDWNTSSLQNMQEMFYQCTALTSLQGLEDWNTASVTNMWDTFGLCNGLLTLQGLEDWNTGSVTNMRAMFDGCTALTDASAINNWNISSVTNFASMFRNCSVHPTFTNRAGTWSSGTFVPSA